MSRSPSPEPMPPMVNRSASISVRLEESHSRLAWETEMVAAATVDIRQPMSPEPVAANSTAMLTVFEAPAAIDASMQAAAQTRESRSDIGGGAGNWNILLKVTCGRFRLSDGGFNMPAIRIIVRIAIGMAKM